MQHCQPPGWTTARQTHYITTTVTPDTQTQGALSQTTAGDTSLTGRVCACACVCVSKITQGDKEAREADVVSALAGVCALSDRDKA